MEYMYSVPEVSNNVTLDGPCLSPILGDLVYEELQSSGQSNMKELGCITGGSPYSDHGYESDSIGSFISEYNFSNQKNTFEEIYSDILTTVSETCPQYTETMSSNVNNMAPITYPVDYMTTMKMEPIDEGVVWTTDGEIYTKTANNYYINPQPTQTPRVSDVCQTTNTMIYTTETTVKYESYFDPTEPCYVPANDIDGSLHELEISENEDEDFGTENYNLQYSPIPTKNNRRRRSSTKQPILWKFLLKALNNPEKYEKMIFWIDRNEGTFQFSSQYKEELSKEWGEAKRNRCTMTYQKMARALRNYINRGEIIRKVRRKLQYTFIPEFYATIQDMVVR